MIPFIFLLTYLGIALGRIPRLAIDRTGIALLGALAMILLGGISAADALNSIQFATLLMLYGLMILSAQLRLGGFYTALALHITGWIRQPRLFLLLLMLSTGLLSAVLANDIICLAVTPVLAVAVRRRGLPPLPFMLGLAMATNLGSASTLIGNPQSMLIGQLGGLSFRAFLLWCAPPSLLSLAATFGVLLLLFRKQFNAVTPETPPQEPEWTAFNRWQSTKGLIAASAVVLLLLFNFPRELSVISVAGLLLLSRKMHTRSVLGLVDWHLITLFCGLFIVVAGFNRTGLPEQALQWMASHGWHFENPFHLTLSSVLLSNLVSNVPATILLSPHLPENEPVLWYVLSLATTYAGNLFTIGSMANLIVIEQARRYGIRISFLAYARVGIVVTAVNLLILFAWIGFISGF